MAAEITDVPGSERYELRLDGELAGRLEYRGAHGGTLALTHTEVDERFEGQGLGSQLIAHALADARQQDKVVLPMCPFVKAYLARHPEDVDLVEPGIRRAFGLPDPPGA